MTYIVLTCHFTDTPDETVMYDKIEGEHVTNYPAPPVHGQVQPQTSNGFPLSLKVTLWSLVGLTLCVIAALFAGDIPYRGTRIFATIVYFAAFVGFTIFDMSRARKNSVFPTELAVGSNIFILAFGLITSWIVYVPEVFYGADDYYYSDYSGHYETALAWFIPLVLTVKAVVYCGYGLRKLSLANPKSLTSLVTATIVTASLTVFGVHLATILNSSFGVEISDWYWKIMIALLMLVALGVSASFLIAWYTRLNDPDYQENKRQQAQARLYNRPPAYGQQYPQVPVQQSVPQPVQEWPVDANGYAVPVLQDGTPDLRYAWFNQPQQAPVPAAPASPVDQTPPPVPAPATYYPEPEVTPSVPAQEKVEVQESEEESSAPALPQVNLLQGEDRPPAPPTPETKAE